MFGYTGREWYSDIGLQYNRARWYDLKQGRWISQDPIGFAAGDENLYRYVGNGPTNATDPRRYADDSAATEEFRRASNNKDWIKPDGYTWHHQTIDPKTGKGRMILVNSKVHKVAGH